MDTDFASLLKQIQSEGVNAQKWAAASREFIPGFIHDHKILKHVQDKATVVLHGSTTLNVDDPYSDLDFWLILDEEEEMQFNALTKESFFLLEIQGKQGHINPFPLRELRACFNGSINMVLAYEVKNAIAILDKKEHFQSIKSQANTPLTDGVRYAHFFRNYIEMRASHRSCDNPMERHDHFAMLYNVMDTLKFALQAAFVLDRKPYPYDKWIYAHAHRAETPKTLVPLIDNILEHIASGPSALHGPERDNKISQELRKIRAILVEKARQTGIDQPWLNAWWRFIEESKRAVQVARWGS